MSGLGLTEFQYLLEELRVFQRNLSKDNDERRKNSSVTHSKLRKLDNLKLGLSQIREAFNSQPHSVAIIQQAKTLVDEINSIQAKISEILQDRLSYEQIGKTTTAQAEVNSDTQSKILEFPMNTGNMTEKFDLRTAASLLPLMNDSEIITKQLIDAIEFYNSILDNDSKKLLISYVLKTRLSPSAKIRLNQTYQTTDDLVADLKKLFITKKSASALSVQLHNAKQNTQSVEQFGKSIEELLVNLTLSQAEGADDAIDTLKTVNEKIAINVFANGLRNHNLRTIIKARNYSKLSEAINAAKDEDAFSIESSQVFHLRRHNPRHNFQNSKNTRNRRSNFHPSNTKYESGNRHNNYKHPRQFTNSSYGHYNKNHSNNPNNSGRNYYKNQGHQNNTFQQNRSHRSYFMKNESNENPTPKSPTPSTSASVSADAFFRLPRESKN